MPFRTSSWSRLHLEALMAIATTLGEYTQSLELAQRIPAYLSDALGVEPLTIAILRDNGRDESHLVLQATSGAVGAGEAALAFAPRLLDICRQTRPLSIGVAPSLRSSIGAGCSELEIPGLGAYPKALVFCRTIDAEHRLVILVHQRVDETGMSMPLTDALQMVAGQLAKLFKCLFAWQAGPQSLGGPFERLTDREWMVLRGLNSDDGEKQLADRLSLSPHTLHSHIKSIYRKVGVQGRLPLLSRLQTAMRDLRMATLNTRDASSATVELAGFEQPRAASAFG
ncbi:MAG TPA: LuxR C-terminal-related transcriptional regulator [Phycisphaerae bacterium]|nr:LuxR C-terminal-related transcriptional regulator [Phycisphaerae bacterium]